MESVVPLPLHTPLTHTLTHITQSCNQLSTCRLQCQLLYLLSAALQFSIKMFAQKTPHETAVARPEGRARACKSPKRPSPGAFAYSENEREKEYVLTNGIPGKFTKIFSIVKFVCAACLPWLLYYIFLLA